MVSLVNWVPVWKGMAMESESRRNWLGDERFNGARVVRLEVHWVVGHSVAVRESECLLESEIEYPERLITFAC